MRDLDDKDEQLGNLVAVVEVVAAAAISDYLEAFLCGKIIKREREVALNDLLFFLMGGAE